MSPLSKTTKATNSFTYRFYSHSLVHIVQDKVYTGLAGSSRTEPVKRLLLVVLQSITECLKGDYLVEVHYY